MRHRGTEDTVELRLPVLHDGAEPLFKLPPHTRALFSHACRGHCYQRAFGAVEILELVDEQRHCHKPGVQGAIIQRVHWRNPPG